MTASRGEKPLLLLSAWITLHSSETAKLRWRKTSHFGENMQTIIRGGSNAPIRLQLIGKNGAGKDGPGSDSYALMISGGELGKGETLEIELSTRSVAELQIIASNPSKAADSQSAPSIEIVAGGGGNIVKRNRSNPAGDSVLVCDIVAAGGGN